MTLSRPLRWALGATLAACVVLAWLPDEADVPAVTPPSRATPMRTTSLAAARQEMAWPPALRSPRAFDWPLTPQRALAAWGPPPTPIVAAKASAPEATTPQPPPFPYTLIGRIDDQGVSRALLAGAQRTLDAKAGDVIDGQWRVETVRPDALLLVWLPGGQQQTVNYRPT